MRWGQHLGSAQEEERRDHLAFFGRLGLDGAAVERLERLIVTAGNASDDHVAVRVADLRWLVDWLERVGQRRESRLQDWWSDRRVRAAMRAARVDWDRARSRFCPCRRCRSGARR